MGFFFLRKLLNDIWEKDTNMMWTMAPKPTMADSMYHLDFPWDVNSQERKDWIHSYKYVTNETEPVFEFLFTYYCFIKRTCSSRCIL